MKDIKNFFTIEFKISKGSNVSQGEVFEEVKKIGEEYGVEAKCQAYEGIFSVHINFSYESSLTEEKLKKIAEGHEKEGKIEIINYYTDRSGEK